MDINKISNPAKVILAKKNISPEKRPENNRTENTASGQEENNGIPRKYLKRSGRETKTANVRLVMLPSLRTRIKEAAKGLGMSANSLMELAAEEFLKKHNY